MFVIAGVTGHVGAVAATKLLQSGKKVRVIVRDEAKGATWKEKGAELAVGSLDDLTFLTRTLTGAEGAFLLVPPSFTAPDFYAYQVALAETLKQAVAASKIPHVVLLSSIGADKPTGTGPIRGLYVAERNLLATGARTTFVRAAFFMENWAMVLQPVTQQGVLPNFFDEKLTVPMIATRDIGALVARALLEPASGNRVFNLAGPKDYTVADVATTYGNLLNKPIQVFTVPAPGMVQAMTANGLPPAFAELYAEMYQNINSGHIAWASAGTSIRGETSLDTVLEGLLQPTKH